VYENHFPENTQTHFEQNWQLKLCLFFIIFCLTIVLLNVWKGKNGIFCSRCAKNKGVAYININAFATQNCFKCEPHVKFSMCERPHRRRKKEKCCLVVWLQWLNEPPKKM
jgi:hypothetical protein